MSAALPGALYVGPEAYQRERRQIFAAAWLLLGRAELLRTPGDYLAVNLAGWPVFAVRDDAGDIAACRNVCRHQALPVLNNGTGNCGAGPRCRYHGWTYNLAGRFESAPAQVAPADPADPVNHLPRLATALHAGLVFVHLAERAEPPPLDGIAELAALAELRFAGPVATDVDANWKLVMEHALAAPEAAAWRWPNLALARPGAAVVLRQIVPRAFQRTQLVAHVFVDAMGDAATAVAAEGEAAAVAKAAAEAAHAAHEAGGAAAPAAGAVAAFRDQVMAAHPRAG